MSLKHHKAAAGNASRATGTNVAGSISMPMLAATLRISP